MRRALWLCVLLALPARAADLGLNVGALEVLLLPEGAHGGFYPYVGASVTVPMSERLTFVGSLSFEWSFDQQRGGFVVVGTLDFLVAEHFGLDLNLAFIHDQPGLRFGDADYFLGVGPGVSLLFGKWSISPFLNFFGGLRLASASMVPGLNVGRTF